MPQSEKVIPSSFCILRLKETSLLINKIQHFLKSKQISTITC